MSITTSTITELAPDQESLNAASKLMKKSKWPSLAKHTDLVWGECQGSGANPYRTVFDNSNVGYKCTCPSRKFPCKHVLALMWMYVEQPSEFADQEVPVWVTEWMGRRRSPEGANQGPASASKTNAANKSLTTALNAESEKPRDPQAEARRLAMAEKRSQSTRQSIAAGLDELQQWLNDQLRGGLASFLNDPGPSCRTIASRLVDAKAQAMASRLDELPSRLKRISVESRLEALLLELGRIVLICRAWKASPEDAELARLVGTSETRDSVLECSDAPRVRSRWEVVGDQVATRRDGLVSQSTWLMNLGDGLRFGLLLDFFPASLGKRSSAFAIGEQFDGELVYYPARQPLRAVIADKKPVANDANDSASPWPQADAKPLEAYRQALKRSPWIAEVPLLLPEGRIAQSTSGCWWQSHDRSLSLPMAEKPSRHIASLSMQRTAVLWDGVSLTLLSGESEWGRWSDDS